VGVCCAVRRLANKVVSTLYRVFYGDFSRDVEYTHTFFVVGCRTDYVTRRAWGLAGNSKSAEYYRSILSPDWLHALGCAIHADVGNYWAGVVLNHAPYHCLRRIVPVSGNHLRFARQLRLKTSEYLQRTSSVWDAAFPDPPIHWRAFRAVRFLCKISMVIRAGSKQRPMFVTRIALLVGLLTLYSRIKSGRTVILEKTPENVDRFAPLRGEVEEHTTGPTSCQSRLCRVPVFIGLNGRPDL